MKWRMLSTMKMNIFFLLSNFSGQAQVSLICNYFSIINLYIYVVASTQNKHCILQLHDSPNLAHLYQKFAHTWPLPPGWLVGNFLALLKPFLYFSLIQSLTILIFNCHPTYFITFQIPHLDLKKRKIPEDLNILLLPFESIPVTLDGLIILFVRPLEQTINVPAHRWLEVIT